MADDTHAQDALAPGAFGSELGPALIDACDGRLTDLRFFRADWQQGGAATAYGVYRHDDGTDRDVVVKVPVGPAEYRFTTRLAAHGGPTPGVAACGAEVGGYDLAWMALERLPGEPLARNLAKQDLLDLADAVARYYQIAEEEFGPPTDAPSPVDWSTLVEKARQSVRENSIPEKQRWKEALKQVSKSLDGFVAAWRGRAINTWRHGDLHPGNAMRRPEGSPWGQAGCVLIDLANASPGHWVTDAVYLERLHWGKPELLHKTKPVKLLAKARKKLGLDTNDDYSQLAHVRRILMAACTPAFLEREGHPKHLAGALEALEKSLQAV